MTYNNIRHNKWNQWNIDLLFIDLLLVKLVAEEAVQSQ